MDEKKWMSKKCRKSFWVKFIWRMGTTNCDNLSHLDSRWYPREIHGQTNRASRAILRSWVEAYGTKVHWCRWCLWTLFCQMRCCLNLQLEYIKTMRVIRFVIKLSRKWMRLDHCSVNFALTTRSNKCAHCRGCLWLEIIHHKRRLLQRWTHWPWVQWNQLISSRGEYPSTVTSWRRHLSMESKRRRRNQLFSMTHN